MHLHSKRLLTLWDQKTFGHKTKRHQKPIDGIFIFHSLFSVAAFASRSENTLSTKLAQKTSELLLTKMRDFRNDILRQHRTLQQEMGSLEINRIEENTPHALSPDPKRYTPENTMLIKIFFAYDAYFMTLNKAKMNGELTEREHQHHRKTAVTQLIELLNSLNRTCLSFHKVRKSTEATS